MNAQTITGPGVGGAAAVLFVWWLQYKYQVQATAEQTAALASGFTVLASVVQHVSAQLFSLIYKVRYPAES